MRNKVLKPTITEEGLVIPIEYIKQLGDVEVVFQNEIIVIRTKNATKDERYKGKKKSPPTGKLGLKTPFDREELYEEIVADRF